MKGRDSIRGSRKTFVVSCETSKHHLRDLNLTILIARSSQAMSIRRISAAALVCALLMLPGVAFAHAHLLSSTPAANATVHGPEVAFELRFNSRVDGHRSVLTLVTADGQTQVVTMGNQSAESNLNARATLKPGSYTLRWQALSTDGHITRGEIPFSVR
jgi:methionine-rich copper-binding protein CopC